MPTPELKTCIAQIISGAPFPSKRSLAKAQEILDHLERQGLVVVRKDSSGEMHRMVSQTYDGEIGWGDEG